MLWEKNICTYMMSFTTAPRKITELIKNQSQGSLLNFKFLLNSSGLHSIILGFEPPHPSGISNLALHLHLSKSVGIVTAINPFLSEFLMGFQCAVGINIF